MFTKKLGTEHRAARVDTKASTLWHQGGASLKGPGPV